MVANEVNKFGQIFPMHRVISILLISPPKVIYAELFCVKDTPHLFSKLISESACMYSSVWSRYNLPEEIQ
jgi:hypothetical protein